MPTIGQQLAALVTQKNSLAANLNTMGVTASESETLNTLVPKVLDIHTGGSAVLEELDVTVNGDYYPETGVDGFDEVHVAVPNTYAAGDEGKVVSNGALKSQSTRNVNTNGTYDTTENNQTVVAVPNSYAAADEDKVVHNGELVAQTARTTQITQNGTYSTVLNNEVEVNVSGGGGATLVSKSINANGTYDPASDNADGYSAVTVAVPNSYSASDEGKVVSSGALVAQGSDTVSENGILDTTLISSLTVNVSDGGGYPEPTGTIQITQNGTVNVKDYASAEVNVPNSYAASDEGKVVKNGALIEQTARSTQITVNGTYDTTENNEVTVNVSGSSAVVQPLSVAQNGTYTPPSGVDGYAPVTVNVSGGGSSKCFEVYAADGAGGARTEHGFLDNKYFACFFDDNMSSNYTLNGVSATYSTIATGKQQILATTREVTNPSVIPVNALIAKRGSVFTASHGDSGSYISVVGGWVGYPAGGTIYESAAVGTSNSVTLNSAHGTLLIFVGASSNTAGITTIDLNGATYTIENIGYHFGAYGMYTAIEINGNTDTNITVTFPASCWSYVSVIGIDS